MVQWRILLMVVVMKFKKKVVPSIRGGLRASCCGQCHNVQVRTATVCPGVHYVCGYCCNGVNKVSNMRTLMTFQLNNYNYRFLKYDIVNVSMSIARQKNI